MFALIKSLSNKKALSIIISVSKHDKYFNLERAPRALGYACINNCWVELILVNSSDL